MFDILFKVGKMLMVGGFISVFSGVLLMFSVILIKDMFF